MGCSINDETRNVHEKVLALCLDFMHALLSVASVTWLAM